jgi:hypothetical protein
MPCEINIICLINSFYPYKHNLSFATDKLILTYRKICSSLQREVCHDTWQSSCKSTKEKVHPITVMWWTGSNYAHPVTCLAMANFFYVILHVTIIDTCGAASDFLKNLLVTGKICIKLRNVLLNTDFTILLYGTTRAHVVTVIIIRSAVLHKTLRFTYTLHFIL